MGLTWAIGWAVGGLLIGVSSLLLPARMTDSFFQTFDAPLPALAIPGFFAGIFFSIVLRTAARHSRFRDLSLPRFAAWGAAGGVMLSLVPFAIVGLGLGTPAAGVTPLGITARIFVPFVVLSVASATATLLLARRSEDRESPDAMPPGASDLQLRSREGEEMPLLAPDRDGSRQRSV